MYLMLLCFVYLKIAKAYKVNWGKGSLLVTNKLSVEELLSKLKTFELLNEAVKLLKLVTIFFFNLQSKL